MAQSLTPNGMFQKAKAIGRVAGEDSISCPGEVTEFGLRVGWIQYSQSVLRAWSSNHPSRVPNGQSTRRSSSPRLDNSMALDCESRGEIRSVCLPVCVCVSEAVERPKRRWVYSRPSKDLKRDARNGPALCFQVNSRIDLQPTANGQRAMAKCQQPTANSARQRESSAPQVLRLSAGAAMAHIRTVQ